MERKNVYQYSKRTDWFNSFQFKGDKIIDDQFAVYIKPKVTPKDIAMFNIEKDYMFTRKLYLQMFDFGNREKAKKERTAFRNKINSDLINGWMRKETKEVGNINVPLTLNGVIMKYAWTGDLKFEYTFNY